MDAGRLIGPGAAVCRNELLMQPEAHTIMADSVVGTGLFGQLQVIGPLVMG
jgi:hypothetical protein